jgi:hypothetical protein
LVEAEEVTLGRANALYSLDCILRRRFLVRDLLWCVTCDVPWVPVLLRPMTRYYACANKACPLPAMPAGLVEHRVWGRFVRVHGVQACQVPREQRHEALTDALRRVLVCPGLRLRLEWWG